MNRFLTMFIPALALGLPAASMSVEAEEFSIYPGDEIREAIDDEIGGPPELQRQVDEYLEEYDRASQYEPRLKKKSESISLSASSPEVPFEIEVSRGYLTTLTFLDANGHPYPTRTSRVGNSQTFIVCVGASSSCQASEEEIDIAHILTIGTNHLAGRSNLKVFFKGMHRAVQIPLVSKKFSYHDEVTIVLPTENPDAERELISDITPDHMLRSDDLVARGLIDDVPISEMPGAIRLDATSFSVTGEPHARQDALAVYVGGNTYLRTTVRRTNPQPTSVTPGHMGTMVYRYSGKRRVVTGLDSAGMVVTIKIDFPERVLGYKQLGVRHE